MNPYPGYTLQQLWDASEHYICRKASRSREVPENAILQMVRGLQHLPRASPPDNLFVQYLGRPQRNQAPPERSPDTKSTGGVETNDMRKQGGLYSRKTPGGSTCSLPKGWRSDVNRYPLGTATARGARFG